MKRPPTTMPKWIKNLADNLRRKSAHPMCEECNYPLHRYHDPTTGKDGWSCDLCGWSWDDDRGRTIYPVSTSTKTKAFAVATTGGRTPSS
jgi:hypothetical protein